MHYHEWGLGVRFNFVRESTIVFTTRSSSWESAAFQGFDLWRLLLCSSFLGDETSRYAISQTINDRHLNKIR